MSFDYSITLNKPHGSDYTLEQYQDRITDSIWFTRLNAGGPLFNIKYYIDESITPTRNLVGGDFWYEESPFNGGTYGVKWGILSSDGFPDVNAPGINPDLFCDIVTNSNFFSFSQVCTLLTAMINLSSKPISLTDPSGDNTWLLQDSANANDTNMPYLENKDLACYIPATNQYFKIHILTWGYDGNTTIEYERTPLFFASDICFPAGTPVLTDQGYIEIECLKPGKNTIGRKNIIAISQTISNEKHLVCFEKDALALNIPSQNTIMTLQHKVLYNNTMEEAQTFIGKNDKIYLVPYDGEILYNVLMENHETMNVNNMKVETLHPEHKIAKLLFKKSLVPFTKVSTSYTKKGFVKKIIQLK